MRKIVFCITMMVLMMIGTLVVKADYPTSQVEKHDVAILVIDMQNDFVKPGAVLCVDGALKTVPDINKLIEYGRSKNWKV